MSVDLKGNTNFACFKNLQDEYIVPRTNLAAVDLTAANGIMVSGNTIGMELADPLQLTTATDGSGAVTAAVLSTALRFARDSVFNVTEQGYTLTGNSAVVTDEDGTRTITAIPYYNGATADIGITFDGPLPVVSTVPSIYLVLVDVKTEDIPADSIILSSNGAQIPVTNYGTISTTTNVWTRLAFVLDTTSESYTGNIKLVAQFPEGTGETSLIYKNLFVADVIDLSAAYRDELASVLGTDNAYIWKPGYGVKMSGGTVSMDLEHADVKEILQDSTQDNLVAAQGLKSAISTGKAVDVTSEASVSAGILDRGLSAKDPVVWTGATGGNIGFYSEATAFPKFADTLVYLMLADVTNNGTTNVVIDGANGLNGTLPVTITPQSTVRVAKIFTTQTDGYFSVSSTVSLDVTFKLREYEVTGCTNEARAYIAGLEDPDNYNDYYLMDQDSVNPWLNIINMKDSPYTTVMAGLAYKLYANDGQNHTIMVDTIPPNTFGREARLELFVGGTSDITLVAPLRLANGNSFTANTLNNCSIRFQDGLATLTVDSVESSYIVNLAGGTYTTESGTVYAAIISDNDTILFNSDTNGLDCDMYGAVSVVNVRLYGNGVANTILVGSGTFGNYQAKLNSLSFKGATVSGSAIEAEGDIGIVDKLTNNGAISVDPGVNVVLAGAATNSTAMDGNGSISFGNGCAIDASQNETGGIVLGSANNTITVPASTTVSFKGLNGYSVDITGSKSGKYLLADGSLVNSFYAVSTATGQANGSLYYGLANDVGQYITFAKGTDGTPIVVNGCTTSHIVNIIGNGSDKTIITYTDRQQFTNTNISYVNLSIKDCDVGDSNLLWGNTNEKTLTLNNCLITGCITTGVYLINPRIVSASNCTISGNTAGNRLLYSNSGGSISNCQFIGNKATAILMAYNNAFYIDNCYFSNPNCSYAITSTQDNGTSANIRVTGCTFATSKDSLFMNHVDASVYFGGTNILNADVAGSGKKILTATSNLDLRENSIIKVITGGTITAESGSQVIPYGETEPVAVEGTGNTLLNTGKLGFLVSNKAATTAANTLYDALVGGGTAYSNIIFDTALPSGTTVSIADTATVSRTMLIDGNGKDVTNLNLLLSNNISTTIKNCSLIGCDIRSFSTASGDARQLVMDNCNITATSSSSVIGTRLGGTVTNCYFTGDATATLLQSGKPMTVINCVFERESATGYDLNFGSNPNTISGSTTTGPIRLAYGTLNIENSFLSENREGTIYAIQVGHSGSYTGTVNISGSTFNTFNASIRVMASTSKINLNGTNVFNARIFNASDAASGYSTTFGADSILDLSGNTNSTVISGATITVEGTATVIPYGGGTPVTISGSGTTLSNMGVLS